MIDIVKDWYYRHFSDPNAVALVILILISAAAVWLLGDVFAPVIAAVILAYLLEGAVAAMEKLRVPRTVGAFVVMLGFVLLGLVFLFGLVPLLYEQIRQLINEIPRMTVQIQERWQALIILYPELINPKASDDLFTTLRNQLSGAGQAIVTFSISNAFNFFAFAVYAVLVPMMVFFGLKDKTLLLTWADRFLPERSDISDRVWAEVDQKIANYIRGKFIEVFIIGSISYIVFGFMGLNYALLLGLLVGLSVIIPFVGAFVITFPVLMIAFFQWGVGPEFYTVTIAYMIIQILDGNVLVPILFSEAVNLHPLAIIVAVVFFGGVWGVWGIFFAIPLATFLQALLNAWPSISEPAHSEPPAITVADQ